MNEGIFTNLKQIQDHLSERYRVTYYRIQKACERRELVERRGGWTVRTVEQWARAFLVPLVDTSPDADAPSLSAEEQGTGPWGAWPRKNCASRAVCWRSRPGSRRWSCRRRRGSTRKRRIIEDELAARARAFRLGLERFGHESGQDVAAVYGATPKLARKLAERLGFSTEDDLQRAQVLIQDFLLSRAPQYAIFFSGAVERLLDSYATGRWWTDEMREAWTKLEEGGAHE